MIEKWSTNQQWNGVRKRMKWSQWRKIPSLSFDWRMESKFVKSTPWTKRVEFIEVLTDISTCNLLEEEHWNRRNQRQRNARKTQLKIESELNLRNHWTLQFHCSLESKWNHERYFDRRRQIFHTSLFTDEVGRWSRRNDCPLGCLLLLKLKILV